LELIELKTNIRTTTGNGPARRLRQEGQIPAVLYGPRTEPALLSVNISDLDPVSRNFLHVDFYEITMDRKIRVKVPVITKGKSKGVEIGGILQIIRRELEVQCLPLDVPESIEVDIMDLDMGDSIHVSDIPRQSEIEFLDDENFTVVTIVSPKVEEEVEPVEEEIEEGEEIIAEEGEERPESGDKE